MYINEENKSNEMVDGSSAYAGSDSGDGSDSGSESELVSLSVCEPGHERDDRSIRL